MPRPKKSKSHAPANPTPPADPSGLETAALFGADEVGETPNRSPGSGRRAGDALPKPMYRATAIAKILGVSDMFVSRLMRRPGAPYADAMGRYDLYETIQFLQTGRAGDADSDDPPVTQEDILRARLRALNAKSAADEYALEVRRGEHISTAAVLDILADCFAAFRRVVRALPAEIQRQTAAGTTAAEPLARALADWLAGQERTMDAELSSAMQSRIDSALAAEREEAAENVQD